MSHWVKIILIIFTLHSSSIFADNQTATYSPILPESGLPFKLQIEKANFQLPTGVHSGAVGVYRGLWIFIAGQTSGGLHGFSNVAPNNNIPVSSLNNKIMVVDPSTGSVVSKALNDPSSGLTQTQIDSIAVTNPQFYQEGNTLYMTGGYGWDTSTQSLGTKPVLTAFNLPGIVDWVYDKAYLSQNMQQIFDATFQITGGRMFKIGSITQLVLGQTFTGFMEASSNGAYSEQIRRFRIKPSRTLAVDILPAMPMPPDPSYRRRDLNVLPVMMQNDNSLQYGLVALAGVFTLTFGVWTVPIIFQEIGVPIMPNPSLSTTFKQGMNQYASAIAGLYSRRYASTYGILFGGISFEYISNGAIVQDNNLPFINQITTIQMTINQQFSQYIMSSEFPTIRSTTTNPGNQLYFGAEAYFIPQNISIYPNNLINLDAIRAPTVIGYVVGGIASTLQNTNAQSDSFASPYIFKVTLIPQ